MFRLTELLVADFLRDRDRPRELADFTDFADLFLRDDFDLMLRVDLTDFERFLVKSFLPLRLLRLLFLLFFDFLLLELPRAELLLLADLDEDRPLLVLLRLLLRRLRAEVGALLLAERCFLISCISAIMLFILRFFRLVSVASIIDVAMSSRFCEKPSTRLLNCDTPLPLLWW